jgi:hypothetical protein
MIQVVLGVLAEQHVEGLMYPVRSDLAPVSTASRDVVIAAGEELQQRTSAPYFPQASDSYSILSLIIENLFSVESTYLESGYFKIKLEKSSDFIEFLSFSQAILSSWIV